MRSVGDVSSPWKSFAGGQGLATVLASLQPQAIFYVSAFSDTHQLTWVSGILSFTPGRTEGSQSSSRTNAYFSGFLSSFIPFMEDSSWQGVSAPCQLSYLILRCVPKIVEGLQCLRGRKLPETVPLKENLAGRSQTHWTAWGRWHATSVGLISPVLSANLLVKGAVLKVNYQYFSIRRCKIKDSRILSTGQIL